MCNWVKDACPCKRRSASTNDPGQRLQISNAGSVCLSFLKPFKKRRCSTGSSGDLILMVLRVWWLPIKSHQGISEYSSLELEGA